MCLENNKSLGDRSSFCHTYSNASIQTDEHILRYQHTCTRSQKVGGQYCIHDHTLTHTLVGTMWKNSSVYKLNKKFLNKMSVMQKGKASICSC